MFLKNILVPLDGSPLSERALPYAAELARAAGASLTLVRTADVHPRLHLGLAHLLPEDPSSYLNMHADRLRTDRLVVDPALAPGEPPEALVAEIERRQPDLVLMSTHGRSGIDRLVHASVTDTLVSHIGCPVMLVHVQAASGASAAPRLAGRRVVVPLDGSRFSEAAVPVAVDLARALGSDILLVQAIVPVYQVPPDLGLFAPSELDQAQWLADTEDAASDYLDGLAYRLSESEQGLRVTGLARVGLLAEVIRELTTATEGQLDSPIGLVVMATHSRTGLARALLGGEADAVVRGDNLPVVLVHPYVAESAPEVDKTLATSVRGERGHA
jgi:nucleotide-binding universal stress UspA family protein